MEFDAYESLNKENAPTYYKPGGKQMEGWYGGSGLIKPVVTNLNSVTTATQAAAATFWLV